MFTKEDYVSLETAKLLKEKGFDEPVLSQYSKSGSVWVCSEPENFNDSKDCFSRPTLYEAQKWLKDRKGLVVEISYMSGDYYIYDILTIPNHDLVGLANRILTNYNTFQQALDTGIQEALKLI